MSFRSDLVKQFRQPQGRLGVLAGWVMANRPSNVRRNQWTVSLLDLQPDDRVLEIGCGPGLSLAKCAKAVQSGRVVGVDHSAVMIAQASSRNAPAIRRGVLKLHLGGLEILPTLGTNFTKVLMVNVAQFFADKRAAFSAIVDGMAPGAMIAVTYQPRTPRATEEDAKRMVETFSESLALAGCTSIRTRILPLQPAPAMCVLAETANPV